MTDSSGYAAYWDIYKIEIDVADEQTYSPHDMRGGGGEICQSNFNSCGPFY